MPSLEYYLEKIPADAPPSVRERMIEDAKRKVEEDVFGIGFKRDANGRPIERGIGSVGNELAQHVAAILKYEGSQAAEPAREALVRTEAARAKK